MNLQSCAMNNYEECEAENMDTPFRDLVNKLVAKYCGGSLSVFFS
jgi:hypothetical protein